MKACNLVFVSPQLEEARLRYQIPYDDICVL